MPAITGLVIIVTIVVIVEPVEIAPVHHDGVARGAPGTDRAVLRIEVDRAGTGELTPRPADDARGRLVPAVRAVPKADVALRLRGVDELLRQTAVGEHELVTLGVELELTRPDEPGARTGDHAERCDVATVRPPGDPQRRRDDGVRFGLAFVGQCDLDVHTIDGEPFWRG